MKVKTIVIVGGIVGVLGLIGYCQEKQEKELANKPRAVTRSGYTATYTQSDFQRAWNAGAQENAVVLADMAIRGHLIDLPVGEEVIVLSQEGEFVELKFVNRTTHPDVWAHKESIEMKTSRTSSPSKSLSTSPVKQRIPEKTDVEAPPKEPSQFVLAKTTCNIRGGPGTKYSIVRKATKGEKLEYISLEGNWYKLKVAEGKPQEWVHKNVIIVPKTSKPQTPQFPHLVNQITVNGKVVKAGDMADDVFKILKPEDIQGQEIAKDPNNLRSIIVTKYYKVEGKSFALVLKRFKDPGPYRVEKIILGRLPSKSPAEGKMTKK